MKVVRGLFGHNADVYVFGSRLDDSCKGGDIDILVQVEAPVSRMKHARLVLDLEEGLDLTVDVAFLIKGEELTAFQKMVFSGSTLLFERRDIIHAD